MSKTIISEGKTTNEAVENGLKQLKTTKNNVEIKVLEEEEKRSFFSILTPRVVKVELTVKNEKLLNKTQTREAVKERTSQPELERPFKQEKVTTEALENAKSKVELFLQEFFKSLQIENSVIEVIKQENGIVIHVNGDNLSTLIGYRGETLNALQTVVSAVANRDMEERCKVLLDIQGYRKKREKTLEELAEKISKTVVRTRRSITLEPMSAYERKIIHTKLQENNKVKTYSIGEEPYRKLVISLK